MRNDLPVRGFATEETILQEQAPIFAHLASLWIRYGRTVPGQADPEWHRLAAPPRFSPPTPGTTGEYA
ncbi:hypothetical protein ACFVVX_29575 [Kitasatospora sp. NPDC058170]|uniref:hypothetical protein n=1 Tax=Kitasatospora sp. NPDC058170 TaxID=3346364 RepID=UPI0036DB16D8